MLPPSHIDVVFSVRWKSGEYCSCGYMLRNSANTFRLLDIWLGYRFFIKTCVENPPLHSALLEFSKPKSPHLPRCKKLYMQGRFGDKNFGARGDFMFDFDSYVNCVKYAMGPGIEFGSAQVLIPGHSWYNTVAEDIKFMVTGQEFIVHGVKHADWLWKMKGTAEEVRNLKEQCAKNPSGFKVPPLSNLVSSEVIRRAVVRSDFEKTLEFKDRPIRPVPQVFDCWPHCDEKSFYFVRDPNEEYKCVDEKGVQVGNVANLKTKDLLKWVDQCHACPQCKVLFA